MATLISNKAKYKKTMKIREVFDIWRQFSTIWISSLWFLTWICSGMCHAMNI